MTSNKWKSIFIALYTGQFFSLLSSAAVQFSMIWWLTDTTGSPLILAMAGIAGFLPQALIGPLAGTLIDRYSRKLMMIAADLTVALGSLLLFITMLYQEPGIGLIIVVLVIRSLATAFHMPAMQATIPLLVPEEHLTKASGWGQMVGSITNIAGPALGMSILAASSLEWVLLIDVFGALIASTMVLFIKIPKLSKQVDQGGTSLLAEMKEGYHAIVSHLKVWRLAILIMVVSILYIPVGTYFPLMVRNHFDQGVLQAGMVEIVFAIGLIVGASVIGIFGDRFSKVRLMAGGMLIMGVALFISGILPASAFYVFVVMSLLIGLSGPIFSAPFSALIQSEIEPHLLGRVFSFIGSMSLLAAPIGLGIAGVFIEFTNVAMLFMAAGVLIVVNALITWRLK
ncbi:MFS transporter [Paenibacillus shunpengii]|uniref:MFS transporter n=1 Tax=Paenibacillus shunpengii TaxID=2054424 RepID=A0ABW5SPD7_9BACL|nr:MFS transporter [Paenibacillus sp. PDC88]SDX57160.1 MFS transporter, DHA3 family, macrolide efflux protein [Paenibacillus sp. PDC88]